MNPMCAALASSIGIDGAVADDILRWGIRDDGVSADRHFWVWIASRIEATPIGRAYMAGAAAVASSGTELDRLAAAGLLVKTASAGVIAAMTSDVADGAVETPSEDKEKALEQFAAIVGGHFSSSIVRKRSRLFSMADGQTVRLIVSKPHRHSGEAFVRIAPDHFEADWLAVATTGLPYGWIVPMAKIRDFMQDVPHSSTHNGKSWWNVHFARAGGVDKMWVTRKSMLLVEGFRKEFGQVIGDVSE
ncbi:hypothetical protein D3C71_277900 [compost metagenome]